MAVQSVNEMHEDCMGTVDAQLMRSYQRKFRVICTDRFNDRQLTAMTAVDPNTGQAIPLPRDPFPDDPLFCVSGIQARGVSEDGKEWEVLVNYSYIDPNTNPLLRRPDISWQFSDVEVPADIDTSGRLIANKAGDPFDPPVLRKVNVATLVYVRNEATFLPSIPMAYNNCVNSDPFYGAPPKTVQMKIAGRQMTEMTAFNGQAVELVYYSVEYQFTFSPFLTFRPKVLNQGLRQLVNNKLQPILVQGVPATSPVPLDNQGKVLPPGGTPVWLDFDVCNELDFNAFGIVL